MDNETTQYSRDSLDEIIELLSNWHNDSTHFEHTFECFPMPDREALVEGDLGDHVVNGQKTTLSLEPLSSMHHR